MGQFSDLGGIMALQGFAQLHSFLLKILNKNVQQFPKKPFIILNSFQKLIDVQDFHVHFFLSRAGCKLVPDTLTLITMAKILNKATTIVKTTMQAVMINDQSLLNSRPTISVPTYPMSISARAIVAPAAVKMKRENRQEIRTTYRLYKGMFPLLILLAAIPIRFMEVFYHYQAITQGLGPYLLPKVLISSSVNQATLNQATPGVSRIIPPCARWFRSSSTTPRLPYG